MSFAPLNFLRVDSELCKPCRAFDLSFNSTTAWDQKVEGLLLVKF